MKNNQFYIGIDIGGTKISIILTTASGKIIARLKSPQPKNGTIQKIISVIVELFEEILNIADINKKSISAIGVGVAGIVDSTTGKIIRTPNMKLSGINLKKILEDKLKIDCHIGNDTNLATLAEKWLGVAKDKKNVVGLFIGTGIGGGIIIDDKLLTGSNLAAAELGHMILKSDGPRCSCGNVGCFEALASRWAIERDIRFAIKNGRKTIITKLLKRKNDKIKSKLLYKAISKGDSLTKEVVKKASEYIGVACISIRHIFDPEMIILGGGVIKACGDFILPIVRKVVKKDKFFKNLDKCEIVKSKLADDAVTLGAVALARKI